MKGLLIRAAERSKGQTLIKRMKNAYVFKVTFETDSTTGTLLNHDYAEFHISYRMLYQFSTEGEQ
ncbi:hypothetical protein P3T76_004306 [Phytophthora citrophthora]|uniref:Uncharacterized protein n=1 Tax=Phytophthora citrophthora TaxID=4793 RepID=A0AAD9LRS4_9STRA|nr:hypothetical protein P3T76_004306 [Phytophthora citrophthora]